MYGAGVIYTFQLPKRGQPPYKGQNSWPQSVLYLEVPLYLHLILLSPSQ